MVKIFGGSLRAWVLHAATAAAADAAYSNPPKRGLLAQSQVLGFLVWNWAFINILCSSLKVEREFKVLVVKIGLRMTDYTSTGRIHWPRAPRRLWVPASQSQAWNDVMENMKKVLLRK